MILNQFYIHMNIILESWNKIIFNPIQAPLLHNIRYEWFYHLGEYAIDISNNNICNSDVTANLNTWSIITNVIIWKRGREREEKESMKFGLTYTSKIDLSAYYAIMRFLNET